MKTTPVELTRGYNVHSAIVSAAEAAVDVMAGRSEHKPHVLLATTSQLASTARLAMEFHEVGAHVSLIAPGNHPARVLDFLSHQLVYRPVLPQRCLEASILQLRPDLVIPCDERTVRDLHALCRKTRHSHVKRLIEASTAPRENFRIVASRAALLACGQAEGVRVAPFTSLSDDGSLDRWIADRPAPFVLKSDGSWAGLGVRIASDAHRAKEAFRQMTRPASGLLGLREALLEKNYFCILPWLQRVRPVMSVQQFIDGRPANIGVACWKGEVLAAICAEAVATHSETGSSTAVRIIHNAEMIETAKRIVSTLQLTGLIGFDFMIENVTGAAWLIEMNPRNTPICSLNLGPGRNLVEALVSRLAGAPVRERPSRTERDIIVFFPDTWRKDPSHPLLHTGYHDVPWEQPALLRKLVQRERREQYWVFRMLRRLWLATRSPGKITG